MAKKGNILVVDDEEVMRDVLESLLSQEGYRVDLAKTGEEGLARFGERTYDVVLLDVSMPGIGGLRTLEELLKLDREAVVLMITAYATFDTAIAAWQLGAFSAIRKPFENESILKIVAAGIARRRGDEERRVLRRTLKATGDRSQIVGTSTAMREVYDLIEQVAPARSTWMTCSRPSRPSRKARNAPLAMTNNPAASSPAENRISSRVSRRSMARSASAVSSGSGSSLKSGVRRKAAILSVLIARHSRLGKGKIQEFWEMVDYRVCRLCCQPKGQGREQQKDQRIGDLAQADVFQV